MAAERALFRCDRCRMELHLLGPVERACPACGGTFKKVEEFSHPLDALSSVVKSATRTKEDAIDEIIEAEFPRFMEKLEEYLYAHVEMDKYSRGDEDGEEEGVSN